MSGRAGKSVFARVASRPIPRVLRMMRVSSELGQEPVFCGALREQGIGKSDEAGGWPVVRLGNYYPMLNGRHPFLYLKSVYRYNRDLYRFLKSAMPVLLHASDIETMPASILFRMRHATRLVYNIHDNLSQRYDVNPLFAFFLNSIEGLCVRASDVTIVPETFRRNALPAGCRQNVMVVQNTVEDMGYCEPDLDSDRIRVFFGGWLDWGRGLAAMLRMAEQNDDIELRIAGEGDPEITARLQSHPRITYLGFVSHDVIMEETRRSHFIAALYDPVRPINRHAAPNKIAEAFSAGRPVIANREMLIADEFRGRTCVVDVEYGQAEHVVAKLRALKDDANEYRAACRDARRAYEERFAWEPVRASIRDVISGERGG